MESLYELCAYKNASFRQMCWLQGRRWDLPLAFLVPEEYQVLGESGAFVYAAVVNP